MVVGGVVKEIVIMLKAALEQRWLYMISKIPICSDLNQSQCKETFERSVASGPNVCCLKL